MLIMISIQCLHYRKRIVYILMEYILRKRNLNLGNDFSRCSMKLNRNMFQPDICFITILRIQVVLIFLIRM